MTDEKPTFTYRDLMENHRCEVAPNHKKAFFAVMEDGAVVLIIARAHPDDEHLTGDVGRPIRHKISEPVRWQILEYIPMQRDDFNVWLHQSRRWWDEEKRYPSVTPRRR